MRKWFVMFVVVAVSMLPVFVLAQNVAAPQPAEIAIRAVLDAQVAAWNAGDIEGFMHGYENSPQTTFIGKTVRHGYTEILANYKSKYSTRAKMGTLTFSDIDVRMLCPTNAVVTGKYKLVKGGAAKQSGIFSLVWEQTPDGWRVVLDHTS